MEYKELTTKEELIQLSADFHSDSLSKYNTAKERLYDIIKDFFTGYHMYVLNLQHKFKCSRTYSAILYEYYDVSDQLWKFDKATLDVSESGISIQYKKYRDSVCLELSLKELMDPKETYRLSVCSRSNHALDVLDRSIDTAKQDIKRFEVDKQFIINNFQKS